MTDDRKRIVPFGKYKGQPVERLMQDEAYLEWLLAQEWFRQRFEPLYTVVINHGQEPAETPEHNRLVARFLDEEFRLAFVRAAGLVPAPRSKRGAADLESINIMGFEHDAIDVTLELYGGWEIGNDDWSILAYIEVKPTVSDDFPSILRQCLDQRKRIRAIHFDHERKIVCLIGHYTGVGATLDQVRQMFAASGIRIVMLEEVETELAIAAVNQALSAPEEDA